MSRPIQQRMVRDEIAFLEMRRTGTPPRSMLSMRGLADVTPTGYIGNALPSWYVPVWYGLAAVSSAASAYHGYKRNRGSVGWAVAWGALGGLFPVITPAIAVAEGFGKPAKGKR